MIPENLSKNERIKLKKEMGLLKDRHSRKLEKFSDNFNTIFNFFLRSYRKKLLNFGGIAVDTHYKKDGYSAKETFRRFDDGQYNNLQKIESRQNNILHGVITAKKSWGLHVKIWTEGIVDRDFTIEEIVNDFEKNGITIPESLMKGFINEVKKQKANRYESIISERNRSRNN